MKIRKRVRDGKEYGNWCLPLKGGCLVNLETKDARLANKRAALYLQGKWPEDVAGGAAEAAAQTEEVEQPLPVIPEVSPKDGGVSIGGQDAPQPAAAPQPVAAAAGGSDDDLAAAAAAAAGDVRGAAAAAAGAGDPPSGPDFSAELGELFGAGEEPKPGEAGLGEVVAAVHLGTVYRIANAFAGRMKPPREVQELSDKDLLFKVTATAWRHEVKKWFSSLGTIEPWHVLVGATLVAPVLALVGSKPIKKQEGQGTGEETPAQPQG